jgi:succinoglycan biosynthesis transport protein ExoP
VSLLQFLRILFARRGLILAAALSCFIVAIVVAKIVPPRYDAEARILLDVVKPDPVTGMAIGQREVTSFANTQAKLIMDYEMAGLVVDRLGWANNPAYLQQAQSDGAIDARRWLAQSIVDRTNAQLMFGSNIMTITYGGTDPDTARTIVDTLRSVYLEDTLRRRRAEASKNADWYRNQTEEALKKLQAAEAKRTEYARANNIVLDPSSTTDLESLKLNALSSSSAMAAAAPAAPGAIAAPSRTQLDAIEQQIAQAGGTLGPNHPTYQALLRQRSVLAGTVAREEAMGRSGGGVNVAAIERAYEAQRARVLGSRDKLDALGQMQREIDLRRDEYLKAAQRMGDFRLESDIADIGITPLGDASVPSSPTFPNMVMVVAGSLIFGLGLGVLTALLVELLARRVRGEDDLEYATDAPVFATISERKPDGAIKRFIKKLASRRPRMTSGEAVEA